ncbi:hypothetical protein IAD21_00189 [Abditibacteriota bacterium]|nr:hypothetical protein IAD21_00189 [Abditibacteriota bacterium]
METIFSIRTFPIAGIALSGAVTTPTQVATLTVTNFKDSETGSLH